MVTTIAEMDVKIPSSEHTLLEQLSPADSESDTRLSRNARAFSIDALLFNDSSPSKSESLSTETTESQPLSPRKPHSGEDVTELEEIADVDEDVMTDCLLREEPVSCSERHAETECSLEMSDLWSKFHDLGTEMIITKSGRRMFPSLRVSFSNLEPKSRYQIYFDVSPVDNKRYRYAYHRSSWLVAGRADPPIPQRCYTHPDGPFIGESLQKQSVSFEKVKLTNNLHDKWDYIILNSMHKYQPRVHLVRLDNCDSDPGKVETTIDLTRTNRKIFTFTETQFIGVTAYQNQLITKLKIDSNPFAKGFRDSARITQIDRDSVDLLIKASRHGGFSNSSQYFLPHHNQFNQLSNLPNLSSHQTFPTSAQKMPPLMPPLPMLMLHNANLPKDIFKFYLEQLSNQDKLNSQPQTSSKSPNRYHPYNN